MKNANCGQRGASQNWLVEALAFELFHASVGLLLPILGALPDALIIVVSGLGGTKEEAAEQVPSAAH